MKFMKKRKIRRIASLFMAVLMVAALMPGSITNTKADDKTAESGVVVDAGTWENNERTTTWDFSKYSGSSSLTLAEGDDKEALNAAISKAYQLCDKAVSKGILHKNTAARKKSRLVLAIKKLAK